MPDETAKQTTTATPAQPRERSDEMKPERSVSDDEHEQGEKGEEGAPEHLGRGCRRQRPLGKARARPRDRGDEHRDTSVAGRMVDGGAHLDQSSTWPWGPQRSKEMFVAGHPTYGDCRVRRLTTMLFLSNVVTHSL